MLCKDVMYEIEKEYPLNYALSWDNVGLLVGRDDKEVKRIYIALDATDEVIDEAVRTGADMLITHHPMIFSPIKRIHNLDFVGERILKLIQNDISYYAMHTNYDVRRMAELAARRLGWKETRPLEISSPDGEGLGRITRLDGQATLRELGGQVRDTFGLEGVRIFGDLDRAVETAAILPGAGKSLIPTALGEGAQALITGDIGHHEGIDAAAQGLSIIDAGHYGIEHIFIEDMKQYFAEHFPGVRAEAEPLRHPFATI